MSKTSKSFSKNILTSMFTFFIAVIAMVTAVFAWFSGSDSLVTDDLVIPMGTFYTDYDFSKIVDGVPQTPEGFIAENTIPGTKFLFCLTVNNDTENVGTVDCSFLNVASWIIGSMGQAVYDYGTTPQYKVQFAYTFRVITGFWVPNVYAIYEADDLIETDTEDRLYALTDDELDALDWIRMSAEEETSFVKTPTYFNQVDQDEKDLTEYYFVNDLPLAYKSAPAVNEGKTTNKSSFLVFFEIAFQNIAVLPNTDYYINLPLELLPDSNRYLDQRLQIDHVKIQSKTD